MRILGGPSSPPALETVLANVERAAGRGEDASTEDRTDLLEVIGRVGVALLSSASLEQVLEQIVDLIFDALPVERAFVLLRNDDSEPRVIAARSRDASRVEPGDVPLSQSVVAEVLGKGRAVLTSDAQEDQRFRHRESVILSGLRSLMAVPLATGGETFGMISVDSPCRFDSSTKRTSNC